MPTFNGIIADFVVGDDLDIERNVSQIPSGQTVEYAWFTVRFYERSYTTILQREINTTLTSFGLVGNTVSGTCQLTFTLSGGDTRLFEPDNSLHYDIQIRTNLNKIYTPETGTLTGRIQITE
jgi:hypothetical protein